PAYNRSSFLRLTGRLDTAALERSLNEIVRRHEVLRTTFPSVDGRPYQLISPALTVALPIVDLRKSVKTEREAEARRLAVAEGRRPFDLTSDPPLRAALLRLDEEDRILVLTTHHIAFDGWSDGILFEELAALYKAFSTGRPSPLSDLPIQYADYAAWQRQRLDREALDTQLAYWKPQLSGAPPVLELPTDRPRPPVATFRGARQSILLPEAMSDGLKALSRHESVTLFMMLLAAFKVLLCRYTGQHDIMVGTPIAGRDRVETERLIGVFINTLVLRTDLSGDPTFRELLRRVRDVFVEACDHQELPFEKLVEELQPKRDMSRNPIFQVMFQLRNAPKETIELPDLQIDELDFDGGTATLDLTLEIVEKAEGVACRFDYNTDLFDAATITRMAGHFQTLLQGILTNPDQPISQVSLITELE
ncbi:MAG: condensation domain-containing protein, partial [bacterium]